MKKKNYWPLALILLPVAAMLVACLPDAVTYQYPNGGKTMYGSYFALNQDLDAGVCMPAAAIAVGLCVFFAVAYGISRKPMWLKAVSGPSFAAALLAVLPLILREDILVAPNVLVPIFMMLEWFVAYKLVKQAGEDEPEKKTQGVRLERH